MSRTGSLYEPGHSFFHHMDGAVKLVLFVVWTVLAFMFMDLRVFVVMLAMGTVMLVYSRVPFRKMAFLFGLIVLFAIINGVFILLITPTFGTRLTGTNTPIIPIGYAVINQETLFYVLTLSAKYLTLLPMTLLCLFTTMPSAFAASLNRVGVPYKIAYAVSIALRYIPDLIGEFRSTMHSMEARGMGISKEDGSMGKRLSNLTAVVVPVLQSALHRIDSVTSAMELRGFGAGKKRTWYSGGEMKAADWTVIGLTLVVLGFAIWLRSRGLSAFWYPFA